MNLEVLVKRFREDADDNIEAYLFDTPWIVERLNDAENEACIRARLIHESSNVDVCQIAVVAGTAVYPLHASLYEIDHLAFRESGSIDRCTLKIHSTEWLDDNVSGWRDLEGNPEYAVQTDSRLRLVPKPNAAGTLLLEGYRTPLTAMEADEDEPEINKLHHRHLVQWALFCAFNNPDVDFYDPNRAAIAEKEFEQYFGKRPDSDLRRSVREDEPQHVVAFMV